MGADLLDWTGCQYIRQNLCFCISLSAIPTSYAQILLTPINCYAPQENQDIQYDQDAQDDQDDQDYQDYQDGQYFQDNQNDQDDPDDQQ